MRWIDTDDAKILVMNATGIDAGSTAYSTVVGQFNQVGYAAILLTSTATGTFSISMQASIDSTNFYDPVDSGGSGAGAVLATVTFTSLTNYIMFSPPIAPYSRLKVIPTEDNTVTIRYLTQGDKS